MSCHCLALLLQHGFVAPPLLQCLAAPAPLFVVEPLQLEAAVHVLHSLCVAVLLHHVVLDSTLLLQHAWGVLLEVVVVLVGARWLQGHRRRRLRPHGALVQVVQAWGLVAQVEALVVCGRGVWLSVGGKLWVLLLWQGLPPVVLAVAAVEGTGGLLIVRPKSWGQLGLHEPG